LIEGIESIRQQENLSYMDAILAYCEKNGVEVETVGDMVKNIPVLRAKVQEEAEALHFLPKTSKLPL
jgi:hypothetical protein